MKVTQEFIDKLNENSLYKLLGITIETVNDEKVQSRLEPNPDTCWPVPGQPHGGVVFTLMDTTMAIAAIAHEGVEDISTVHLDIQYIRPAKGERLKCLVWVIHRTSRTCFLRAEVFNADGEPVAMGQSTYRTFSRAFSQFFP